MVFHTNLCKFLNFQTVVKYFLKHYLAQISFLLTKSKLFSSLQKVDNVTNNCKKPIRFLSDVFGCCHLEILLPWQRDETTFPLHLTTNLIRGSLRLPSFADW